jgi:peptide subunit release factor 1 (eRF1)
MARIIELNIKEVEKVIVHENCGAKIGYYLNDIQSYKKDYYDGSTDIIYFVVCPNCGKNINVDRR